MIGKITGKLTEIKGNRAYIETNCGIAFLVYLTPYFLDKVGKVLSIYTHHQIKEDDQVLFGFESHEQYSLFQLLVSVDGVGPKSAFSMVSYASHHKIIDAISNNDVYFFQSIPGVGKKTASRIILELSGKLTTQADVGSLITTEDDKTVIEALVSLGFKDNDIRRHMRDLNKKLSLEEKIRQIIVLMTKKE